MNGVIGALASRARFGTLLALAVACGVSTAPTTTPPRAAGVTPATTWRVVDAMPAFRAFWERAESASPDERVRLFREIVIAAHPELYAENVIGSAAAESRLRATLARIDPLVPTIDRLAREIGRDLERDRATFLQAFPDMQWSGTVYFSISLDAFDGAVRRVGDEMALVFGLDKIARLHGNEASLTPLIHHELFHLHHERFFPWVDDNGPHGLVHPLWTEGLAVFVARALNPNATLAQLTLSEELVRETHAREPVLARELRAALDVASEAEYHDYFTSRGTRDDVPRRAGYVIGLRVAERIARGRDIATLTRLHGRELRDEVDRALGEIEGPHRRTEAGDSRIVEILERLRAEHRVPGAAAAVFDRNGMLLEGVVGVRAEGHATRATLDDRWHLGSNGKAMTATLIARLVERGALGWSDTMRTRLPEDARLAATSQFLDRTIDDVLRHRAGITDTRVAPSPIVAEAFFRMTNPRAQRRAFLPAIVASAETTDRAPEFAYANMNYWLAGVVTELVTDRPFEELLRTEVFIPLGMRSCGFGAPGNPLAIDEPRGHGNALEVIAPAERGADNIAASAPFGTVHCSLGDYVRFAALHLSEHSTTTPPYLSDASLVHLHEPPPNADSAGAYALGWGVVRNPEGRTLAHAGSNTKWFAQISLDLSTRRGIVVLTNAPMARGEPFAAAVFRELARIAAQGRAPPR